MEEEAVVMQSTLLDYGQSRSLLIQAAREGLIRSDLGALERYDLNPELASRALSQLLTSDCLKVSLDGQTCEMNIEGDLIDSRSIEFLPYGYDRGDVDLSEKMFPTIDLMADLITQYGHPTTPEDLISLVSDYEAISSVYMSQFGDRSAMSLVLSDVLHRSFEGRSKLSDKEAVILEKYQKVTGQLSRVTSIIEGFSRKVEVARNQNARLSLDIDNFYSSITGEGEFLHRTGLSSEIGNPGEFQVIRTVCIEIGTLPFRSSVRETLKLRESSQFKELRAFSREFLSIHKELSDRSLEKLKEEILHAKRQLNFAHKAGAVARVFTYVGLPLAFASPYVPALGAVGIAATVGGAWATAHQHAREKRFSWANIGIV